MPGGLPPSPRRLFETSPSVEQRRAWLTLFPSSLKPPCLLHLADSFSFFKKQHNVTAVPGSELLPAALPPSTHTSTTALSQLCSGHWLTSELYEGKNSLILRFKAKHGADTSSLSYVCNLGPCFSTRHTAVHLATD